MFALGILPVGDALSQVEVGLTLVKNSFEFLLFSRSEYIFPLTDK
jgi:hypothetical protein